VIEVVIALTAATIASSIALIGFGLDSVSVCVPALVVWRYGLDDLGTGNPLTELPGCCEWSSPLDSELHSVFSYSADAEVDRTAP
jgi:hypothetical protein